MEKPIKTSDRVVELWFYPTYTILVFADGHEEIIEIEGIDYTQEEKN